MQLNHAKCFQELFHAGFIIYVLNTVKIKQAVTPEKQERLQVQLGGGGGATTRHCPNVLTLIFTAAIYYIFQNISQFYHVIKLKN